MENIPKSKTWISKYNAQTPPLQGIISHSSDIDSLLPAWYTAAVGRI